MVVKKKRMEPQNYAFVDVQGFKDNFNRFILKEFVFITRNITFHDFVFAPKIWLDESHQKQANWLTENYHGLNWNDGFSSFSEFYKTIKPLLAQKVIYLKGEEKVKWFNYTFGPNRKIKANKIDYKAINLETLGCTINLNQKFDSNGPYKFHPCKRHIGLKNKKNPTFHCALQNALILSHWYNTQKKSKQNAHKTSSVLQ